jgi:hypothetical protein
MASPTIYLALRNTLLLLASLAVAAAAANAVSTDLGCPGVAVVHAVQLAREERNAGMVVMQRHR